MKTLKYAVLGLVLTIIFVGNARATSISSVPSIMSAPVVLYDEANNVLSDGEYTVIISFTDLSGTTLYAEEQDVIVEKGVAYITIGQGYAVGSSQKSPAGGLSWSVFAYQGDISVEILVDGQANAQELTVLGSQPFSFIAQRALSVADDSITSDKIMDGTITEDDLDEGLVDKILGGSGSGSSSTSGTTIVNAKDVSVSTSIGLNNASGDNVHDVLRGLDTSIDLLRETHLDQNISSVEASITSINNTINNLDSIYATDSQLSSAVSSLESDIASNTSKIDQNASDIADLQDDISGLDTTVDVEDVPVMIRPVAYGYMQSTNYCEGMSLVSGYNVSSLTTTHTGVSINFTDAVTPRGKLIIVTDDVSDPGSLVQRNNRCIRGQGYYSMSSSSLSSLSVIECDTATECEAFGQRAVSFMVYLIPN